MKLGLSVFLSLTVWLSAFGQVLTDPESLVGRSHTERTMLLNYYMSEKLFEVDSAIVYGHIALVRQLAKRHHDPELDVWADLIQAHHYRYYPIERSSEALKFLKGKLQEAKDKNILWMEIWMENLLGNYYLRPLKQYELALVHLIRAIALLDEQNWEDYPLKQKWNYQLGTVLYGLGDLSNSLHYLQKTESIGVPEGIPDNSTRVTNTIGLIYRKMGQLDSADHYFNKTAQLATQNEDEPWVAIAHGNLGENHYLRREYAKAIPLLKEDAAMAVVLTDWGLASNSLALLGDIALQQGRMQEARKYLTTAWEYAHRTDSPQRLLHVYPKLAKFYAMVGEGERASAYTDSAMAVKEKLDQQRMELLSTRTGQRLELERMASENELLEAEKQQQVLFRNSVIIVLLMLIFIAALLFSRHRIRQQQRQQKAEAERQRVENELQLATSKLQDFIKWMQLKNMDVKAVRTELALAEEESAKDEDEQLVELRQRTILTPDDWKEFQRLFDRVHQGFLLQLNEKHPDLTQAEVRFAVLSKLELTSRQMATMLGVSTNAIRQIKLRMRKKLGLTADDDLQDFVEGI